MLKSILITERDVRKQSNPPAGSFRGERKKFGYLVLMSNSRFGMLPQRAKAVLAFGWGAIVASRGYLSV